MFSISGDMACGAVFKLKVVHVVVLCIKYSCEVIVVVAELFWREFTVLDGSDWAVGVGQSFFKAELGSVQIGNVQVIYCFCKLLPNLIY